MMEKFRALRLSQKKAAIAITICLGVAFLGWKLVIYRDIQTLNQIKKSASENPEKQNILNENAALETKLKSQTELLSKSRQADWMIEAVNTLAAESGVTLVSVTPQATREEGDISKISLGLEAQGGYHSLGHFVEKIENYKPHIKINFLRIGREEGLAPGTLKFALTIGTFYDINPALS